MHKKLNIKPVAITIIVVGFLFLLKLQFPHYRISSNNMSPFLASGDIVLVNKLVRNNIKNNDICVFEMNGEKQISRVVGLPGDKLEIVNGALFINDVKELEKTVLYNYKVLLNNHPPLAEYDLLLLLKPSNQFEEYTAELTKKQANKIAQFDFVKSITKVIHPKGYHYSFSDYPIFPNRKPFNWSRDNFGPIIIPKKGEKLTSNDYMIKNNYYFVMGDSRHQSIDSRFFGFVLKKKIEGVMTGVIYSRNE